MVREEEETESGMTMIDPSYDKFCLTKIRK